MIAPDNSVDPPFEHRNSQTERSIHGRPAMMPFMPSTKDSMFQKLISNHPVVALATAGAIGIVLGCVAKRRS